MAWRLNNQNNQHEDRIREQHESILTGETEQEDGEEREVRKPLPPTTTLHHVYALLVRTEKSDSIEDDRMSSW